MTPAQHRVFDAIVAYVQENKTAPTFKDILKRTGLRSVSVVFRHVEHLELEDYISRGEGTLRRRGYRSIRVTQKGADFAGMGDLFTVAQLRDELELKNRRIAELVYELGELREDIKVWQQEEREQQNA